MSDGGHLTRDDLRRWHEDGNSADRERVVGHLAVCDACGTLYGEVLDEPPLDRLPAASPDMLAAGYGAYRLSPLARARAMPWRTPWIAAVGVAATLVVAVVMYRRETPLVPPEEQTVRGMAIRALAPAGAVQRPFSFQWSSVPNAATYEVLVRNLRGDMIWSTEVATTRVDAPDDLENRLRPGEEHSWQVTALDARRNRITQSAPQAFVVASRAP